MMMTRVPSARVYFLETESSGIRLTLQRLNFRLAYILYIIFRQILTHVTPCCLPVSQTSPATGCSYCLGARANCRERCRPPSLATGS